MLQKIKLLHIIFILIVYSVISVIWNQFSSISFSDYFTGLGSIGTVGALIFIIIQIDNEKIKNIKEAKPIIFPFTETFFYYERSNDHYKVKKFIDNENFTTSSITNVYVAKNIAKNIDIYLSNENDENDCKRAYYPYCIENKYLEIADIKHIISQINEDYLETTLYLVSKDKILELASKLNEELKYKLTISYTDLTDDTTYIDNYRVYFTIYNKYGSNAENPNRNTHLCDCIAFNYIKM